MKRKIIDLSLPLENFASEPFPPKIRYMDHAEGAATMVALFQASKEILPLGWAAEQVSLSTHSGTHLDAPYHFSPTSEGRRSKRIDEIPLEWCYGDGVVLDLTHKKGGESISVEDIKEAEEKAGYRIKPLDIVLIKTGGDKKWGSPSYMTDYPGMSAEATLYLLEKGVKIIGIDAYGFDRPFKSMIEDFKRTKDKKYIWPAHFAGREKEYCHLEKLANLDLLPPYGFKVACFPVKIKGASAGWVRVVAIIDR